MRVPHRFREVGRFLLVGGGNFVLGLAIYGVGVRVLGLNALVMLTVAWVAGVVFTFVLNSSWVFLPEERLEFRTRFPKYVAAQLASFLFNLVALHLLIERGGDPFISQVILIPVVVAFSFVTAKFWSLRPSAEDR